MGERFGAGQPPILDLLNLEYIEENLYRSSVLSDAQRPRLYGGQVAAQALYAAGLTVPVGPIERVMSWVIRPASVASNTPTT